MSESVREPGSSSRADPASPWQLAHAVALIRLGIGEIDLATGEVVLFGCAEELLGGPVSSQALFLDRVHPEDRGWVRDQLLHVESERGAAIGAWRIVRPDSEVRWVAGSAQLVRDAAGAPTRHIAAFYDITDRKRTEDALADAEARARAVLDSALNAIVSIDDEGRIEQFNPAAERMFGYTLDEVRGRNVRLLMPSPDRERHDEYLRRYLETRRRAIIGIGREVTGRRKDGTTFPLHLGITETLIRGRRVFIGMLRDLTDEHASQARERELRRMAQQNERLADIGAVTARIAHDFGNPLASLTMTAQRILHRIARDPAAPAESLKPVAELVLETTRRLDGLVREFKEFARETRLDLTTVDVGGLVANVVRTWESEAMGHGIRVEGGVDGVVPPVRADEDKLRRVLDNLVKNALEAIERGPGRVRVTASLVTPERLRITVEDDGPGIPHGLDVFALFETTKPCGTGLGLPICRQIALAHGGGIEFAPAERQGAIFRLELPLDGPV